MGTRIEEGHSADKQKYAYAVSGILPEDFSVDVDGDTFTALLAGNGADDTPLRETTQPAKRRIVKKQTANAAPNLILTRTVNVKSERTTTRTRLK